MNCNFFPNKYLNSVYSINYKKIYKKGYRGLIFDVDNTLVRYGYCINNKIKKLFTYLSKLGFRYCLLSNNTYKRMRKFCQNINIIFISNANKPFKKNYNRAMKLINTNLKNTLFIGDQIFTDIYGAKKIGMYCILVKPIRFEKQIYVILKRKLEKIILYIYKKINTN